MPIRLSKKGWNNVLIFSCMFMIILFNYTSNMFSGNSKPIEQRPLIANATLMQAIDFSGIELQRVGTGWRVLSQIATAKIEQPEQFVATWSQQPLESLASEPILLEGVISLPVVVWIAGKSEGQVYQFMIDHQQQSVYVLDQTAQQWFMLPYQQLSNFIPEAILNA